MKIAKKATLEEIEPRCELITQGCNEVPKAFGGTYRDGEEPGTITLSLSDRAGAVLAHFKHSQHSPQTGLRYDVGHPVRQFPKHCASATLPFEPSPGSRR